MPTTAVPCHKIWKRHRSALGVFLAVLFSSCTLAAPVIWNEGQYHDLSIVQPAIEGQSPAYGWYGDRRFFVRQKVIVRIKNQDFSRTEWSGSDSGAITRVEPLVHFADGAVFLLTVDNSASVFDFSQQLMASSDVVYAQPDILQWPRYSNAKGDKETPVNRTTETPLPSGRGVRVAIIDDGVDLTHPALSHVELVAALNTETGEADAEPHAGADSHGTEVAGLIFGRAPSKGVRALAPDAGLIAVRLGQGWTSEMIRAFAFAEQHRADIINCSWTVDVALTPVVELLDHLEKTGRDGKGTLIFMAAGNRFVTLTPPSLSAIDSVVAVGAYNQQRHDLRSARGPLIDFLTPDEFTTVSRNHDFKSFRASSAATAYLTSVASAVLSRQECIHSQVLLEDFRNAANILSISGLEYPLIGPESAGDLLAGPGHSDCRTQ